MNIDKIPIKEMKNTPGEETYHLGTLIITKGEFANAEKINQIIDMLRDHEDRLIKLENK